MAKKRYDPSNPPDPGQLTDTTKGPAKRRQSPAQMFDARKELRRRIEIDEPVKSEMPMGPGGIGGIGGRLSKLPRPGESIMPVTEGFNPLRPAKGGPKALNINETIEKALKDMSKKIGVKK